MSRASVASTVLVAALVACAPEASAPSIDTSGMEPAVARLIGEARAEVAASPRDGAAWGHLAQALHAHGELDAAISAYERAAELQPDEPRWVYDLALAAHEDRRPAAELERRFAAAAELLPEHAPLYCRLGDARMRAGEAESAAEAYAAALELEPGMPQAHRGLGNARLALGDVAEAGRQLERATSLRPDDAAAWAALAQVYRRLGKDARPAARRASLGRPIDHVFDPYRDEVAALAVSTAALLSRADAALAEGDAAAGAAQLAEAAEARPEDPWVWRNLALALRRAGRFEEARDAAHRALLLEPRFAAAHLELGKSYEVEGSYAKALAPYREVTALEPEVEEGWARLAMALQKAGRAEDALTVYRQAEEHVSFGAETLADRAVAWMTTGEPGRAVADFERALELAPDLERAERGLARARALERQRQ